MEKNEFIEVVKAELTSFKEALPAYATQEDLDNKFADLQDKVSGLDISEDMGELKEAVEEQGLKIKEMSERKAQEAGKTVKELFVANKEKLEKLRRGDVSNIKLEGRADKATVQSSDITSDSAGLYLPGAGRYPNRMPFLKDLFNNAPVGSNSHNVVYYTDQTTDTNSAAAFEEDAQIGGSSDIAWTQYSLDIENVGDAIKVAQRSIENIDFIASEVDFFLRKNVDLKTDSYLYSGTGSNQPFGVITRATAYAAGTYANAYQDANVLDLIRVCAALIGTDSPFAPNYVIMNIADAEKYLYGKKDANNNYIIPQNGGLIPIVGGVNVVVNSGVTAGTLVVGDFSMGTLYSQKGLTVELGYVDDDFEKHLMTMKAYEELNLLIRSVHQGAFRYVSDIDAAIAGLNSGE